MNLLSHHVAYSFRNPGNYFVQLYVDTYAVPNGQLSLNVVAPLSAPTNNTVPSNMCCPGKTIVRVRVIVILVVLSTISVIVVVATAIWSSRHK